MNYFLDRMLPEERDLLHFIPTIPQYLSWIEHQWSDRPALVDVMDFSKSITFSQMAHRIACRRTTIGDLGLKTGAHIAIFDRNSIDAVESFLAVTSGGYVAVMLPAVLSAPALEATCARFDVEAVLYGDEFADIVVPLAEKGVRVLSVGTMAATPSPAVDVDKEQAAAIFFTGGTTGAPKGAVLPHRSLMRGAYNGTLREGPITRGGRYICFLPLTHVFGMIRSTLSVLLEGSTWYSCEDMKPAISRIPMVKPTMLVLVPGIIEILLGLTQMMGPQFLGGQLKSIISGAANVPPKQIEAFGKMGVSLLPGYGLTEGANFTTGNMDSLKYPTSIGQLYPGQEAKLVDDELWIRGDNLFTHYYKDPATTAASMTPDGWFRTGDLVRIDENGYFFVIGRIKNLIILSNGENISPESIEEKFYAFPEMRDCLVSERVVDGISLIAIDILPQMKVFENTPWEEVENHFRKIVDEVNAQMPSQWHISHVTVRKEDFKRTPSLKVARNQ